MEEDIKREIQTRLAMGTAARKQMARRKQTGEREQNIQSQQPHLSPLQQGMQIRWRVGNTHQTNKQTQSKLFECTKCTSMFNTEAILEKPREEMQR